MSFENIRNTSIQQKNLEASISKVEKLKLKKEEAILGLEQTKQSVRDYLQEDPEKYRAVCKYIGLEPDMVPAEHQTEVAHLNMLQDKIDSFQGQIDEFEKREFIADTIVNIESTGKTDLERYIDIEDRLLEIEGDDNVLFSKDTESNKDTLVFREAEEDLTHLEDGEPQYNEQGERII